MDSYSRVIIDSTYSAYNSVIVVLFHSRPSRFENADYLPISWVFINFRTIIVVEDIKFKELIDGDTESVIIG